jgi:hypothetical protein
LNDEGSESDILFEQNDTVWLVGGEKLMEAFIRSTSSAKQKFV